MTPQELAESANEAIQLWSKGPDKIVVAIDGYAGIGKTTLLANLSRLNPDIVPVNWDDFILPREIVREKLSKAEDRSKVFEFGISDNDKLENFIDTFRNTNTPYTMNAYNGLTGKVDTPRIFDFSKKIMVIEGVFMLHPELPRSRLWDKRIYLQGDVNKISERRVKREKERWGENYMPEDHPDSYFRQVVIALERYISSHHPERLADLVLNVDSKY